MLDFLIVVGPRTHLHNVIVSDLEERVSEVFLKSHGMLEAMDGLKREKVVPKVRLLSRLEELKKALDEICVLQERVVSAQSEISSLREQINWERAEKLELKHKVQILKKDMERREDDMKELRADASRQSERYYEL